MPSISNPLLVLLLTIGAYLTRLCYRSPNTPKSPHNKDILFSGRFSGLKAYGPKILEYDHLIGAIFHIILTATFHDIDDSPICPHPENVNPKYFTWTPYLCVCLGLMLTAAPLRLLAFRGLGRNFSFELAKPDQLTTTGVYAYVQHPSYPPFFVLQMTLVMLLLPLDGWLGCFLPAWVVEIWVVGQWYAFAVFACTQIGGLWARVGDEERMLKETFGNKWVQWHTKTARFVPWVI